MPDPDDPLAARPDLDPNAPPESPVQLELEVDGEVFQVRQGARGGTDYTWTSGPNDGYGFSTSALSGRSEQEHRDEIRSFLSMIDPATGFIADD